MAADGDFTAFVHARWPVMVRSAVLLGCSRADAEDIVQTALTRCFTHWRRVQAAEDPDAYAYRVLVNCLAKSRQRRWWGEQTTAAPPEQRTAPDAEDAVADRELMRTALARLSADHRAVLVLRFFADLSEQRTAEVLNIPPGTVKSRVARALAALSQDASLVDAVHPERTTRHG